MNFMDILNQIHEFLAISHHLIINQVSFASIHVLWDWFSQKKVIENLDIIFQKKNQTKKNMQRPENNYTLSFSLWTWK